jgi:glc operon protein GlcG
MPAAGWQHSSALTAQSGLALTAGRAVASAAFGQPSGNPTERADHPTFRGIVAAASGHIFLGQGGVPIIRDGLVIGGVGGTGQRDEDYAQVGVENL